MSSTVNNDDGDRFIPLATPRQRCGEGYALANSFHHVYSSSTTTVRSKFAQRLRTSLLVDTPEDEYDRNDIRCGLRPPRVLSFGSGTSPSDASTITDTTVNSMKQWARSSSSSSSRPMPNFFWRTLDAPNIHKNVQCQRPIDWGQGARTGMLAAALQNDRHTSVYLRLQQGGSSRQRNGADCLFSTSIDQTPPIRVLRWGRQDQLTTVHTNGRCIVWDTSKKQSIQRIQLRSVDAQSVVVNHCTPTFTVADRTGCLETIDTRCKRPVRNVQVSENALTKMVASHDEMCYAVSSSRDGTIRVYDIRMMQTKNEQDHGEPSYASPFQTFDHLHNGSVSAMEWSPHAPGQLATGGQRDGVLCITDVYSRKTGDACLTRQPIHDLVWSRSRSSLVLAQTHVVGPSINIVSYAHKRRLPFHRETWLDTRRRQNEPTACYSLAMSPDGADVAATTNDETVEMLEHMFAPTRRRHSSRWLDDFVPAGPTMCIR